MTKVVIGDATLYNGDCLELLASGSLELCTALVSDPPYGINYKPGKKTDGCTGLPVTKNTKRIHGDVDPFDPSPWIKWGAAKGRMESGIPMVLMGANHYTRHIPPYGSFFCWDKACGKGPSASFVDCEFGWSSRKNPRNIFHHLWMGGIRDGEGNGGKMKRTHPSQKPIELMLWCLSLARIGIDATVLDPYMGTGTTGIACARTGRKFVGVEIDPEYFDIACTRLDAEYTQYRLLDVREVIDDPR